MRQPRTMAGGAVSTDAGRISLVLIGINVAVFLAQQVSPLVNAVGTMDPEGVARGEYWRLLTGEFLHSTHNPLHLAFNMIALYMFGPAAERALGSSRFIATYLTMAVTASTFVYVLDGGPTVGASGAIFGLFGLVFILMIRSGHDVRSLVVLLVLNGLISLQAGISWQAHLGGFLCGLVLGAVFGYAPRASRALWQGLAFALIWLAIVVATVGHTTLVGSGITSL